MIRFLLVLACLAFFALCVLAMRRGWRNRAMRQSGLPALPDVPTDLGEKLLAPLTGLYVGTTTAEAWQDRIVAHDLGERADSVATLYAAGLLVERSGADAIFVPSGAIVGAGLGRGLAGKVMGAGGLLVVRWRLGDTELDTGLRADDKSVYPDWVLTIESVAGAKAEEIER